MGDFSQHLTDFLASQEDPEELSELLKAFENSLNRGAVSFVGIGSSGIAFRVLSTFSERGYVLKFSKKWQEETFHEPTIGTFFGNRGSRWDHAYSSPVVPFERTGRYLSPSEAPLLNVAGYHGGHPLGFGDSVRFVASLIDRIHFVKRISQVRRDEIREGLRELSDRYRSDEEFAIAEELKHDRPKSYLMKMEQYDGDVWSAFQGSKDHDAVLKVAAATFLQVGFTLREMYGSWGFVHGDLRTVNLFYSVKSNERKSGKRKKEGGDLEYEPSSLSYGAPDGSGGSYAWTEVGENALEVVMGDFGISGVKDERALSAMGMEDWRQWSDLKYHFFHAEHELDLNALGMSIILDVSGAFLRLEDEGIPATASELSTYHDFYSFCTQEMIMDARALAAVPSPFSQEIEDETYDYELNARDVVVRYKKAIEEQASISGKAEAALGSYSIFKSPAYATLSDFYPARDMTFWPKEAVRSRSSTRTRAFWKHPFLAAYKVS